MRQVMVRGTNHGKRILGNPKPGTGFWDRKNIWIVIFFCLPLLRGITRPYWISIPPIGEVKQWLPLVAVARLFPLFVSYLLWITARSFFQSNMLNSGKLKAAILSLILLYVACIGYFALALFLLWKDNPVGKHLLYSPNSYYLIKIWEFSRPYTLHALAGFLSGILIFVLYVATKGRVVEKSEIVLVILLGLIHGPFRMLIVMVGAFGLTVLWQIYRKVTAGEITALRITPAFFITSYLVLVVLK